ncbi:MAG: septum formation initiator family protein [Pseudomonadota bacterium]
MKNSISQIRVHLLQVITPIRIAVITAIVALLWFLVLGDQGIYQFRRLIEMKHRLMTERARINEEIDKLSQERQVLKNPENLEMIIRSELGFIRPGEVLYEEKSHDDR